MPGIVAVVGAGPAGLSAAISAARQGASVRVYEHLPKPGRKLLATGGGRCNLSNIHAKTVHGKSDLFEDAFGTQGRFVRQSLSATGLDELRSFFQELGLTLNSPDNRRYYPQSGKSQDVLGALLRECSRLGVTIDYGVPVSDFIIVNGVVTGVEIEGRTVDCDCCVVAVGGRSMPELGSDGSLYRVIEKAGHKLCQQTPALVPLVTEERWPVKLAGVAVDGISICIDHPEFKKKSIHGDLLFTHKGISGPAVLDISGDVAEVLSGKNVIPLIINLVPEISDWLPVFAELRKNSGRKQLLGIISEYLPSRLAKQLFVLSSIPESRLVSDLRKDELQGLVSSLSSLHLTVRKTEGFKNSMVTRGGINLKEVNPKNLESRVVRKMFFAGEVLDLDGRCGGYNLHWAFASGIMAGRSAAGSVSLP